MKLGKDEIQKIFLSALLFAGLLYGYFAFLLKPLQAKESSARAVIQELEPKIRAAKGQLKQTAGLDAQAPEASEKYGRIVALIPDGSPIAWFPPRIVEFFRRQGIERCTVRLARESEAPSQLPDFRRLSWIVDLREVQFVSLGIAIAGLENEEPLLQVDQVQIEPSQQDIEKQHAILTVSNLVKK